MSMAEIMREVSRLDPEGQRELAAYLLHLRLQHDTSWRAEMTRRIDDRNPATWMAPDAVQAELGENKDS